VAPPTSSGVGERRLDFQQQRDQGTPKRGELGDEETHVVAGGDEHGVDRIAIGVGEVVWLEQAIALGVANDRLGRVSSAQFALDGR